MRFARVAFFALITASAVATLIPTASDKSHTSKPATQKVTSPVSVENGNGAVKCTLSISPGIDSKNYALVVFVHNVSAEEIRLVSTCLWPKVAIRLYDVNGNEIARLPPPFPIEPTAENAITRLRPDEMLQVTAQLSDLTSEDFLPRVRSVEFSYGTTRELDDEFGTTPIAFRSARVEVPRAQRR
jgi:hypothetical protein